jgi:hypothetical protein
VKHRVLDVRRFEGAKGWLEIGVLAPGVVHQRAVGVAESDVARRLCARLDELLARYGTLELFDDWYDITGYDTESRRIVEGWTKANQAQLVRIHVLLSSKLVSMAVTVSNLVTGGVSVPYTNRAEFDRVLDAALMTRGRGSL